MLTFRSITQSELKLYDSLDTLKILMFWDIIKTNNVLLLDVNYSEGNTYNEAQANQIQGVWDELYDNYYILLDDPKARLKMDNTFGELRTRNKITQIKNNIDFLVSLKEYIGFLPDEDILKYEQETYVRIKQIDKRIKIKLFDGINPNIEVLERAINALINKYNVDHRNNETEVKKQIGNVYEVVANAESWLERNLNINEMVVSHWIAIEKQVSQKQKATQKNGK